MSHPENPEWLNRLQDEMDEHMRDNGVGEMRCRKCGASAAVNGKFMDILISRGISELSHCSKCRDQ